MRSEGRAKPSPGCCGATGWRWRDLSPRWGWCHYAWGTRADARVYPLARLQRWGRIAMAMTGRGAVTSGSTNVEAAGWVPSPGVGSWNAAWGHAAYRGSCQFPEASPQKTGNWNLESGIWNLSVRRVGARGLQIRRGGRWVVPPRRVRARVFPTSHTAAWRRLRPRCPDWENDAGRPAPGLR